MSPIFFPPRGRIIPQEVLVPSSNNNSHKNKNGEEETVTVLDIARWPGTVKSLRAALKESHVPTTTTTTLPSQNNVAVQTVDLVVSANATDDVDEEGVLLFILDMIQHAPNYQLREISLPPSHSWSACTQRAIRLGLEIGKIRQNIYKKHFENTFSSNEIDHSASDDDDDHNQQQHQRQQQQTNGENKKTTPQEKLFGFFDQFFDMLRNTSVRHNGGSVSLVSTSYGNGQIEIDINISSTAASVPLSVEALSEALALLNVLLKHAAYDDVPTIPEITSFEISLVLAQDNDKNESSEGTQMESFAKNFLEFLQSPFDFSRLASLESLSFEGLYSFFSSTHMEIIAKRFLKHSPSFTSSIHRQQFDNENPNKNNNFLSLGEESQKKEKGMTDEKSNKKIAASSLSAVAARRERRMNQQQLNNNNGKNATPLDSSAYLGSSFSRSNNNNNNSYSINGASLIQLLHFALRSCIPENHSQRQKILHILCHQCLERENISLVSLDLRNNTTSAGTFSDIQKKLKQNEEKSNKYRTMISSRRGVNGTFDDEDEEGEGKGLRSCKLSNREILQIVKSCLVHPEVKTLWKNEDESIILDMSKPLRASLRKSLMLNHLTKPSSSSKTIVARPPKTSSVVAPIPSTVIWDLNSTSVVANQDGDENDDSSRNNNNNINTAMASSSRRRRTRKQQQEQRTSGEESPTTLFGPKTTREGATAAIDLFLLSMEISLQDRFDQFISDFTSSSISVSSPAPTTVLNLRGYAFSWTDDALRIIKFLSEKAESMFESMYPHVKHSLLNDNARVMKSGDVANTNITTDLQVATLLHERVFGSFQLSFSKLSGASHEKSDFEVMSELVSAILRTEVNSSNNNNNNSATPESNNIETENVNLPTISDESNNNDNIATTTPRDMLSSRRKNRSQNLGATPLSASNVFAKKILQTLHADDLILRCLQKLEFDQRDSGERSITTPLSAWPLLPYFDQQVWKLVRFCENLREFDFYPLPSTHQGTSSFSMTSLLMMTNGSSGGNGNIKKKKHSPAFDKSKNNNQNEDNNNASGPSPNTDYYTFVEATQTHENLGKDEKIGDMEFVGYYSPPPSHHLEAKNEESLSSPSSPSPKEDDEDEARKISSHPLPVPLPRHLDSSQRAVHFRKLQHNIKALLYSKTENTSSYVQFLGIVCEAQKIEASEFIFENSSESSINITNNNIVIENISTPARTSSPIPQKQKQHHQNQNTTAVAASPSSMLINFIQDSSPVYYVSDRLLSGFRHLVLGSDLFCAIHSIKFVFKSAPVVAVAASAISSSATQYHQLTREGIQDLFKCLKSCSNLSLLDVGETSKFSAAARKGNKANNTPSSSSSLQQHKEFQPKTPLTGPSSSTPSRGFFANSRMNHQLQQQQQQQQPQQTQKSISSANNNNHDQFQQQQQETSISDSSVARRMTSSSSNCDDNLEWASELLEQSIRLFEFTISNSAILNNNQNNNSNNNNTIPSTCSISPRRRRELLSLKNVEGYGNNNNNKTPQKTNDLEDDDAVELKSDGATVLVIDAGLTEHDIHFHKELEGLTGKLRGSELALFGTAVFKSLLPLAVCAPDQITSYVRQLESEFGQSPSTKTVNFHNEQQQILNLQRQTNTNNNTFAARKVSLFGGGDRDFSRNNNNNNSNNQKNNSAFFDLPDSPSNTFGPPAHVHGIIRYQELEELFNSKWSVRATARWRNLSLAHCAIGNKGAELVFKFLEEGGQSCPALRIRKLDLTNNDIELGAVCSGTTNNIALVENLIRAIQSVGLTHVDLRGNVFSSSENEEARVQATTAAIRALHDAIVKTRRTPTLISLVLPSFGTHTTSTTTSVDDKKTQEILQPLLNEIKRVLFLNQNTSLRSRLSNVLKGDSVALEFPASSSSTSSNDFLFAAVCKDLLELKDLHNNNNNNNNNDDNKLKNIRIDTICLKNCFLTDEALPLIVELCVKYGQTIKSIDISLNQFSPKKLMESVVEILRTYQRKYPHGGSLRSLNVSLGVNSKTSYSYQGKTNNNKDDDDNEARQNMISLATSMIVALEIQQEEQRKKFLSNLPHGSMEDDENESDDDNNEKSSNEDEDDDIFEASARHGGFGDDADDHHHDNQDETKNKKQNKKISAKQKKRNFFFTFIGDGFSTIFADYRKTCKQFEKFQVNDNNDEKTSAEDQQHKKDIKKMNASISPQDQVTLSFEGTVCTIKTRINNHAFQFKTITQRIEEYNAQIALLTSTAAAAEEQQQQKKKSSSSLSASSLIPQRIKKLNFAGGIATPPTKKYWDYFVRECLVRQLADLEILCLSDCNLTSDNFKTLLDKFVSSNGNSLVALSHLDLSQNPNLFIQQQPMSSDETEEKSASAQVNPYEYLIQIVAAENISLRFLDLELSLPEQLFTSYSTLIRKLFTWNSFGSAIIKKDLIWIEQDLIFEAIRDVLEKTSPCNDEGGNERVALAMFTPRAVNDDENKNNTKNEKSHPTSSYSAPPIWFTKLFPKIANIINPSSTTTTSSTGNLNKNNNNNFFATLYPPSLYPQISWTNGVASDALVSTLCSSLKLAFEKMNNSFIPSSILYQYQEYLLEQQQQQQPKKKIVPATTANNNNNNNNIVDASSSPTITGKRKRMMTFADEGADPANNDQHHHNDDVPPIFSSASGLPSVSEIIHERIQSLNSDPFFYPFALLDLSKNPNVSSKSVVTLYNLLIELSTKGNINNNNRPAGATVVVVPTSTNNGANRARSNTTNNDVVVASSNRQPTPPAGAKPEHRVYSPPLSANLNSENTNTSNSSNLVTSTKIVRRGNANNINFTENNSNTNNNSSQIDGGATSTAAMLMHAPGVLGGSQRPNSASFSRNSVNNVVADNNNNNNNNETQIDNHNSNKNTNNSARLQQTNSSPQRVVSSQRSPFQFISSGLNNNNNNNDLEQNNNNSNGSNNKIPAFSLFRHICFDNCSRLFSDEVEETKNEENQKLATSCLISMLLQNQKLTVSIQNTAGNANNSASSIYHGLEIKMNKIEFFSLCNAQPNSIRSLLLSSSVTQNNSDDTDDIVITLPTSMIYFPFTGENINEDNSNAHHLSENQQLQISTSASSASSFSEPLQDDACKLLHKVFVRVAKAITLQELQQQQSRITNNNNTPNLQNLFSAAINMNNILHLKLPRNDITATGCIELVEGLCSLPQNRLITFDVSDNKIGDSAASAIINKLVLAHCSKSIKTVNLSGNYFGEGCFNTFVGGLEELREEKKNSQVAFVPLEAFDVSKCTGLSEDQTLAICIAAKLVLHTPSHFAPPMSMRPLSASTSLRKANNTSPSSSSIASPSSHCSSPSQQQQQQPSSASNNNISVNMNNNSNNSEAKFANLCALTFEGLHSITAKDFFENTAESQHQLLPLFFAIGVLSQAFQSMKCLSFAQLTGLTDAHLGWTFSNADGEVGASFLSSLVRRSSPVVMQHTQQSGGDGGVTRKGLPSTVNSSNNTNQPGLVGVFCDDDDDTRRSHNRNNNGDIHNSSQEQHVRGDFEVVPPCLANLCLNSNQQHTQQNPIVEAFSSFSSGNSNSSPLPLMATSFTVMLNKVLTLSPQLTKLDLSNCKKLSLAAVAKIYSEVAPFVSEARLCNVSKLTHHSAASISPSSSKTTRPSSASVVSSIAVPLQEFSLDEVEFLIHVVETTSLYAVSNNLKCFVGPFAGGENGCKRALNDYEQKQKKEGKRLIAGAQSTSEKMIALLLKGKLVFVTS